MHPYSQAQEQEIVQGQGYEVYYDQDALLATDADKASRKKPSFWANKKRTYCILCCGVTAVLFAVMIPVILFVAVPAFAQGSIDGSEMVFDSSLISNVHADFFSLSIKGKVSNAGPLPADISFPGAVSIYWQDRLLATMELADMNARGGSAKLDAVSQVQVMDQEAFTDFNRYLMTSESFEWRLVGEAKASAMGLTIPNLKLNKIVKLPGFNGFKGNVAINKFDLPKNDPISGIHVDIDTELINPSVIGIEMGAVTFNLFVNGTHLGRVGASNVTILPGKNILKLSGNLVPISSHTDATTISTLFSLFMAGEDTIVQNVGDTIDPGQPVPWLSESFKGFSMEVPFEGAKKLKLIKSVEVPGMEMKFNKNEPYAPRMTSKGVTVKFEMPFDFPVDILNVKKSLDIIVSGDRIAHVEVPWVPAAGNSAIGQMVTNIIDAPFVVYAGKEKQFQSFLERMTFETGAISVTMAGVADTKTSTAIGPFVLSGIKFSSDISFKGMAGLTSIPPKILSLRVVGGTPNALDMIIEVELVNPSNARLLAGDVHFQMKYRGEVFGLATMRNMQLEMGTNRILAYAKYSPQTARALEVGLELLSYNAMGKDTSVQCVGFQGSTDIDSLKPALSKVVMAMTLPGEKEKLIVSTSFGLRYTLADILLAEGNAAIVSYNAFEAQATILHIKAVMSVKGNELGKINHDLSATPYVIAPKTSAKSPVMTLAMNMRFPAIKTAIHTMIGATVMIDIIAEMVVKIGDFPTSLHYEQFEVPCKMEKL